MRLLHLLPLISIATAASLPPVEFRLKTGQTCWTTNSTLKWTVTGFNTFTADASANPSMNNITTPDNNTTANGNLAPETPLYPNHTTTTNSTANFTSPGTSFISFQFIDTTSNSSSKCGRTVIGPPNSAANKDWFSCENPSFRYKFDGKTLGLEERDKCIYTASLFIDSTGYIDPALFCYYNPQGGGIPGNVGTQCQGVTASMFLDGIVGA